MQHNYELHVEVHGGEIVVTLPDFDLFGHLLPVTDRAPCRQDAPHDI